MKRRLLISGSIVAAAAILFVALSIKRVPDGHEALRVGRDGEVTAFDAGVHVVRPGAERFVVYPVGRTVHRFPENGTARFDTPAGPMDVAMLYELWVPRGTSEKLYERFTEDFDTAFEKLVRTAAEAEAVVTAAGTGRAQFAERVGARVTGELEPLGIRVDASRVLAAGGGKTQQGAAGGGAVDAEAVDRVKRVILVGIDGGDWLNIKPLVDAGKLPNFRRIIEEGATGPLRSEEPLLSPLLWTTMATGKYPEEHGILNFTVEDPNTGKKVPITRNYRKVDAFWSMLGDFDRTVSVVGWLATFPAEPINGVMVTDKVGYLAYAHTGAGDGVAGKIAPPDRAGEITQRIVHGDEVPYDEFSEMIHIPEAEFERHREGDFDPKDSINNLILLYASTRSFANVAAHLFDSDRPDVLAVYFEWIDAVGHLFMLHTPPRMPGVDEAEFEMFKDAVSQSYVVQDRILGEFMDRLDDDTILMIVSDHGFRSGNARLKNRPEIWAGNAAEWHRLNGVIGFYGAGVKRGHAIEGASIMDVTPTLLALQGLPRAADMPGRVLTGAFAPEVADRFHAGTVATLERDRPEEDVVVPADVAATDEAMKKLGALGYLNPNTSPNADAHNNLGQRFQQRGEFLRAIEEYQKAIALRPNFHAVYNNLAVCYGKLKRYDEAEKALLKTIELKPDDFYAMNNLAVMYAELGRLEDARVQAERSVAVEPGYVNGHVTLGSIYAMSGMFDAAEREFRTALRLEPGNPGARANLEKVLQQKGSP